MTEERRSKTFWYADIDYGKIRCVKGYECNNIEDGRAWWCPEVGYTLWVGTQLFDNKANAIIRLRNSLTALIDRNQALLDAIDYPE